MRPLPLPALSLLLTLTAGLTAGLAAASTGDASEPGLPRIDDPMLEPPAPAAQVVQSWDEALRLVRERSTALKTAWARVEVARGQARMAWAATLPQLGLEGGVTQYLITGFTTRPRVEPTGIVMEDVESPDPTTYWRAGATLTQPLLAPEAWNSIAAADNATQGARYSAEDAQRQLIGGLAEAVISVITAERLAEIARVSLHATLVDLELTERRHRLGDATVVDVLRAEQEADLVRKGLIGAVEGVRKTREAMGLAVGASEPYGLAPALHLDDLGADARRTCRAISAVEERSDLLALRAQVATAETTMERFNYSFFPELAASTTFGVTEPENQINGETFNWSIGGLLTWNLYDGGLREGRRAQDAANVTVAREAHTEKKRQAVIELERTKREVGVAEATLRVSRHSSEVAEKSADLAQVAFVNGIGTSFILVDSTRRAREAALDVAVREFDLVRAQVRALLAEANCNL